MAGWRKVSLDKPLDKWALCLWKPVKQKNDNFVLFMLPDSYTHRLAVEFSRQNSIARQMLRNAIPVLFYFLLFGGIFISTAGLITILNLFKCYIDF